MHRVFTLPWCLTPGWVYSGVGPFHYFVARQIERRRSVSPLRDRADRLQRRAPLRCLLVPIDITCDRLQTARNGAKRITKESHIAHSIAYRGKAPKSDDPHAIRQACPYGGSAVGR